MARGRRRGDAVVEAAAVMAALVFAGIAGVAGFVLGRETGDDGSPPAAATQETETGGETGTTGETGETAETGATTETGETGGEATGNGGDAEVGRDVFALAGCGNCHTLGAANASGTVGPNLEQTDLDEDEIQAVVTNGRGEMPAFKDQLSEEQIANVAAFVHESRE